MLLRCFLLITLFCWPLLVAAADLNRLSNSDLPVNLEADELTYDKASGRYRASGNVQLQQGDIELQSRTLWWNQISGEVEAEGDVQLTSAAEKMTGSKVRYNLNHGTGLIEDGYVFLKEQNLHVHGKQIERRGEMDYRITEGTFTTCDGEVPSWKFGASQIDVTVKGYARAKHALFYLKDVPSLYLPYVLFPAKADRESGFMVPSVGYSSRRGYQLGVVYYQVIADNQDATLYLDYLSEMGVGKGLEYRYIFGRDTVGEARIYHVAVDKVDGETVDEQRYALDWQHSGYLPGGVRSVIDVEYVNDKQFFEDFGEAADIYNKDKVESLFSLSKNWGKLNLVGQFKYIKDLVDEDADPLQYLPRISFDAARQRIGETPFYFAFESDYTNFWRKDVANLKGQRLLLRPVLSASSQLFDVIELTPEVAYTDRYYWGDNQDFGSQQEGIVQFSIKANTRLQRVYQQPIEAISKLRNTIEPEVIYKYTPAVDQSHLPGYESSDRIAEANRLEYALVSRLTARFDHEGGDSSYRDLLYLRLSQSYDLREEVQERPFSDIRGQLTLLPTDWSLVRFDVGFDIEQGGWDKFAVETTLHDQRENSLSIDYRYDRDQLIDYAALNLKLSILKPLYLKFGKRYDFATNEQLEGLYGLEYRQQCWSTELTFRERERDRTIMITFTLQGIGSIGTFGTSLLGR